MDNYGALAFIANNFKKVLETPDLIHIAAADNNKIAVEFLVQNGIDINAPDFYNLYPIHYAAGAKGQETLKYLIENGAKINVYGGIDKIDPLIYAAKKLKLEAIKILLEHIDVNTKDGNNNNLMHILAINYECLNFDIVFKIVSILIDKGINLEHVNSGKKYTGYNEYFNKLVGHVIYKREFNMNFKKQKITK